MRVRAKSNLFSTTAALALAAAATSCGGDAAPTNLPITGPPTTLARRAASPTGAAGVQSNTVSAAGSGVGTAGAGPVAIAGSTGVVTAGTTGSAGSGLSGAAGAAGGAPVTGAAGSAGSVGGVTYHKDIRTV